MAQLTITVDANYEITPVFERVTSSPVTPSPIATTPSPVTPSPVTPSPVTPSPVSPSPVTPSPVTPSPIATTPSPITPSPITPSPEAVATPSPITPSPEAVATPSPEAVIYSFRLRVTPANSNAGKFTIDGQEITNEIIVGRQIGETVTALATPTVGWRFVRWKKAGGTFTSDNTLTFTPQTANTLSNGLGFISGETFEAEFELIPTPSPITPSPNAPNVTPSPTTPAPITPAPITPAPTPAPIFTWRSCIDGLIKEGNIPDGYVQSAFQGAGGGTCWEPRTEIAFEPSLSEALRFTWRRGSSIYPETKLFKVINPSFGITYGIQIRTNDSVKISVNGVERNGVASFNIGPRASQTVIVSVTPELLDKLADGVSTLNMNIEATER